MSDWRTYAERWTPGGAQTRSKKRLFPEPVAIRGTEGSKAYDSNGREYVDWISGLCAVGLGHQYPEVDLAVRNQTCVGTCFPLPSYLEAEVAELLCNTLGWPEQVRWVKTGSEATAGAMLIARKATGKQLILSIGYHGWHPGHLKGADLIELKWGDLALIERHLAGSYVAGVLLEPMRDHVPPDGYLLSVQNACRQARALFILDEVVTGFRWAIGGATELFNLKPDLACYGKALANGYPLGAIVGSRTLMAFADGVSSTFGGECVGLAAAKATIEVYRKEPVIQYLWSIGSQLMIQMAEAGHPMDGYPVHPRFVGEAQDVRALCDRMAKNGVLMHYAGANPTYAHSADDVKKTVEAACTCASS